MTASPSALERESLPCPEASRSHCLVPPLGPFAARHGPIPFVTESPCPGVCHVFPINPGLTSAELGSRSCPPRKSPSNSRQSRPGPARCFVETCISEHGPFDSLLFGAHQTHYQVGSPYNMPDAGVVRCPLPYKGRWLYFILECTSQTMWLHRPGFKPWDLILGSPARYFTFEPWFFHL